jgi:orotidine-5'-phosphate decarboxylase
MQKKTSPTFLEKLTACWQQEHFICIGLDTDYQQLPPTIQEHRTIEEAIFTFNRMIIDATANLVCAYKPNSAFYEAYGESGIRALTRTISYSRNNFPHIPIILDAKRADIGSTNTGYVLSAFDHLGVDAITVHPYLGKEALTPFLERKDKGIIVLAKTSNLGSGEFQNLPVGANQEPLYEVVARHVAQYWNGNGNCGLVVGATYPEELRRVRELVGDMPLLIPGIGAQGGDVAATVAAGQDSRGSGMIISASRSIIYASRGSDFAEAAYGATVRLRDEINACRR